MRILLLTDKPPLPADSGGAFASLGLIRGLALAGNSVTVVTLYSKKHPFNAESAKALHGVEKVIPVFTDTSIKPAKLVFNWLFSAKPYSIVRFRTGDFEKRISILKDTGFDLAIFEGLKTTIYIDIIKKLKIGRLLYRPHNVESLIWKRLAADERNPVKKVYFNSLAARTDKAERGIIKMVDGMAAITQNDLDWFLGTGMSKPSTVINPGIPVPILPDRNLEINGSVAWIGSLDWEPNIRGLKWFLRYVWPVVLSQYPSAVFHIAGRNPERSPGKWLQGNNIQFSGAVESSAGFLADKSVVVSPLFAGSGIRIKILEAMSLGKPVVATPEAAAGISCTPGEDIIISHEPSIFAGKITELLNNSLLRNTLGDRARENVRKNYDIFDSAEKLLIFHSALPDAD